MIRRRTSARLTRSLAAAAAVAMLLTACSGDPAPDATGTPTAPATSEQSTPDEPATAPLIPDDVIADLDAAVESESDPIASTDAMTEGLPPGGTLEVVQLDPTEAGGFVLRVRISWPEDTRLSPDQHRSLSLDRKSTFVDGVRLIDASSERYVGPTVYAPKDEEQVDSAERFRCLCSDLVSAVPTKGQILSALFGPLGGDSPPEELTVEVPGFEPITGVPVGG
ncbi:MAG: DUF3597 domain-containing protein [Actinomycetales bacterium]|nr:DUF3597 domain-containing protein [Actinomycetales bacterium]